MKKFLGLLEKICVIFAVSCLAVMISLNMIQIFSRYLLNTAFVWVYPLTMLLFVWMTFLGAFVVYHQKKDIVVLFILNKLSSAPRLVIQLITNVLVLLLLALILWQAPTLIRQQSSIMQIIPLPRYFQIIPLLVGIAGIFLDSILESIAALKNLIEKPRGVVS